MTNISQTNLNVMKQYVGAAPQQTSGFTTTVNGVAIPIGNRADSRAQLSEHLPLAGFGRLQHIRERPVARALRRQQYFADRYRQPLCRRSISRGRPLPSCFRCPSFTRSVPIWPTRCAWPTTASTTTLAVPADAVSRPGYVPQHRVCRDLGTQIGPNPNAPQQVVQNTYQIADNVTWIKGNHSMKFGFDGRDNTSAHQFHLQYPRQLPIQLAGAVSPGSGSRFSGDSARWAAASRIPETTMRSTGSPMTIGR